MMSVEEIASKYGLEALAQELKEVLEILNCDSWVDQNEFDSKAHNFEITLKPMMLMESKGHSEIPIMSGQHHLQVLQNLQRNKIVEARKREDGLVEYKLKENQDG